ncbi:unnamed protein product [Lactuca saligna]|uniref:Uncharacterized protein n=1 Tax=Lactuca saligna TaxID=75948 RepID=A0AA35YEA4_LACSI|nr:unnamed protein product [Lactuca saligna]
MVDLDQMILEAARRTGGSQHSTPAPSMDLDEMLLEASGRNQPSTPASRRQGKGSYSDDGSDSRDDDHGLADWTDEKDVALNELPARKRLRLQDPDSHYNHKDTDSVGSDLYKVEEDRQMSELHREMILAERANRKMYEVLKNSIEKQKEKSNQRKDRLPPHTVNRAAHSSARSADRDDDSVGSDLYKGEEDRQRLSKMSELDRAMILAERANRKMFKKFKNCIKKHKEKSNQRKARSPPHTVNQAGQSSAWSADRADAKDVALNELLARADAKDVALNGLLARADAKDVALNELLARADAKDVALNELLARADAKDVVALNELLARADAKDVALNELLARADAKDVALNELLAGQMQKMLLH